MHLLNTKSGFLKIYIEIMVKDEQHEKNQIDIFRKKS
jgi:hypothetical protein